MTPANYGPLPERDIVPLTDTETAAWALLKSTYGEFVDEDTAFRQNVEFVAEAKAIDYDDHAAHEAVHKAVTAKMAGATDSWLKAAQELDEFHQNARRLQINAAGIGMAAGIALGSGITGVLVALVLR